MPLSCTSAGANRPHGEFVIPLVDAIPRVEGKVGAVVFRPEVVVADGADSWMSNIMSLGMRGIEAWLHQFRRLRERYERCDGIRQAFLTRGCSLICYRYLAASL